MASHSSSLRAGEAAVTTPQDGALATDVRHARPGISRATDALLVFSAVALSAYPWAAQEIPGARPVRVALGVSLALVVILEALRQGRRPNRLLVIALTLLVALQIVAAARAPDVGYGVRELLNWTLYVPLALAVWSLRRVALVAFGVLVGGAILLIGVGLQAVDVMGGTWGVATAGREGLTRFTSFLQNPNDFGLMMAICVVIATALAFRTRGRVRVLLASLVVGFTVSVVASSSRGSLVALVLGCTALAAVVRRSRRGPVALIAALGIAALLGSVVRDFDHSVLGATVRGDSSLQARWDRWNLLSSESVPLRLVLGAGYGGFVTALDRSPPNLLVNSGAEEGVLGWLRLEGSEVPRVVTEPLLQGRSAILVRGTGSASEARIGVGGDRVPVIPGRRFRFSIGVKRAAGVPGQAWARLSVKWAERSTSRLTETSRAAETLPTSEWRLLSDEFLAPTGAEFATPVVTIGTSGQGMLEAYLDTAAFVRTDATFVGGTMPPLWAIRRELTVDNGFLRLFLEEGAVGVAAFLAVLLAAARSRSRFDAPDPLVFVVPLVVLVMLSVRALTADLFSQPLWAFLLWLSVSLVAATSPRGLSRERARMTE